MDVLTRLHPEVLKKVEATSALFIDWFNHFLEVMPTWPKEDPEDKERPAEVKFKVELEKAEKDPNRFSGFEANGHILLIGPTGTGKTTWVTTQLCENWFAEYDKFVYFGPSNTKDDFNALFMGAKSDLTINKDKDLTDKNIEMYFFENDSDVIKITSMFGQKNVKTLMFIDDLQSSSKIENIFHKSALIAKNSNITLVLTTHGNNTSRANRTLRDNSRYFIFFRPNSHNLQVYTNTNAAEVIINSLATLRSEHHILIFETVTRKFFFGTGLKKQIFDHVVKPFSKDNGNRRETTSVPI